MCTLNTWWEQWNLKVEYVQLVKELDVPPFCPYSHWWSDSNAASIVFAYINPIYSLVSSSNSLPMILQTTLFYSNHIFSITHTLYFPACPKLLLNPNSQRPTRTNWKMKKVKIANFLKKQRIPQRKHKISHQVKRGPKDITRFWKGESFSRI